MSGNSAINGIGHVLHPRLTQLPPEDFHGATDGRRSANALPDLLQEVIVSNELISLCQKSPEKLQRNRVAEEAPLFLESDREGLVQNAKFSGSRSAYARRSGWLMSWPR
jgi:hypothetical protein